MSPDIITLSLEQGVLETLQLGVISIAFCILCYGASQVTVHHKFHVSFYSIARVNALIAIVLLGRETSWGSSYGLAHSKSDMIEYSMATVLICLTFFLARKWLKNENEKRAALHYVYDNQLIVCYAGILICFALSAVFDQQSIVTPLSVFAEEISELIAYIGFVASALLLQRKLKESI